LLVPGFSLSVARFFFNQQLATSNQELFDQQQETSNSFYLINAPPATMRLIWLVPS
jgi:hypothetical protein